MGEKMEITKDSQLPTWKVISVAESNPSDFKTDQLPINPLTGEPYFDVRPNGWGDDWKAGEPQKVTEKELFGDKHE